jgi:hypothetical protein
MNRITLAKRKTPIMNFELKALTAAAAAREKCDLLLVLVSEQAASGTFGSDAIGAMVAHAVKQGDFALSCGKQLPLYQVPAIAARRVVLLGVGRLGQGCAQCAGRLRRGAQDRRHCQGCCELCL